jgi:hypothetical protein
MTTHADVKSLYVSHVVVQRCASGRRPGSARMEYLTSCNELKVLPEPLGLIQMPQVSFKWLSPMAAILDQLYFFFAVYK